MKVGIIGRTNVGKSTIFNKLIGNYRAVVTDIHGTTRENFSDVLQIENDFFVRLFDSPGLADFEDELTYIDKILNECDLVFFVLDGKYGYSQKDVQIKDLILKNGKQNNTILIANKLDGKTNTEQYYNLISDYFDFGFETVLGISAKQGENISNIKEYIKNYAEKNEIPSYNYQKIENSIPVAFIGRPSVGKSTLLNKFVGEDLARVEEEHGTTLDYIYADISYNGQNYKIYDTGGIRKKGKIQGLEKISYQKTKKLIEFARPVVVVIIDIMEGIKQRDLSIISEIEKMQLPLVIAINKVDEVPKDMLDRNFNRIVKKFHFVKRAPIVPISAKSGYKLDQLLDFCNYSWNEYNRRLKTHQLIESLKKAWIDNPPRFPKNKICKFYYITQVLTRPPVFKVFVNDKEKVNFSFKKWLENTIRESFHLAGTPIRFEFENSE